MDSLRRYSVWIVALLAVAASITGLRNGFAYDDVAIIVDNDRVHSLAHAWRLFGQTYWPPTDGASLYRPLTMLAFAIEWSIGRGSPLPFHAVSIVLYAGVCVALYRLLKVVTYASVALIASALFAVHPVHTEAVANVVGQAELLVALALFLGIERYIRARKSGKVGWRDVLAISGLYLAGCLSKEHAIILPGLLIISEVLINPGQESAQVRLKKMAPTFCCLVVIAVTFISGRTLVTGGLRAGGLNELFGYEPYYARVLTMLTVVIEWVRLLFWPAQLSADYGFPRTRIAVVPAFDMVPGVLVIVAGSMIAWHVRRTSPIIPFAFLWIAITMAIPSNLFIVTGFVLAERTLFLASAGVTVMVALGIVYVWNASEDGGTRIHQALSAAVALLLVCGVSRSATRNPVWRDNESLLFQTIEDAPFSSRAHRMLAEYLAKTGHRRAGAQEMMLAVALGRKDDPFLTVSAADQLQAARMCSLAIPLYDRALALQPINEQLRINASLCFIKVGRPGQARLIAMAGISKNKMTPKLDRMVAFADSLVMKQEEKVRSVTH